MKNALNSAVTRPATHRSGLFFRRRPNDPESNHFRPELTQQPFQEGLCHDFTPIDGHLIRTNQFDGACHILAACIRLYGLCVSIARSMMFIAVNRSMAS